MQTIDSLKRAAEDEATGPRHVIHPKSWIGEDVYFISDTYDKDPCQLCEETRIVTIKGGEFSCPKCNGRGYSPVRTRKILHGLVNEVVIIVSTKKVRTEQYRIHRGDMVHERSALEIYLLLTEAQRALEESKA